MESLAKFFKDLAWPDPLQCMEYQGCVMFKGKLDRLDQLPLDAKSGDMYEISGYNYVYTTNDGWIKC